MFILYVAFGCSMWRHGRYGVALRCECTKNTDNESFQQMSMSQVPINELIEDFEIDFEIAPAGFVTLDPNLRELQRAIFAADVELVRTLLRVRSCLSFLSLNIILAMPSSYDKYKRILRSLCVVPSSAGNPSLRAHFPAYNEGSRHWGGRYNLSIFSSDWAVHSGALLTTSRNTSSLLEE